MARNRIRSRNTLHARHVWQLFSIIIGVTLFFLGYVILEVRIHALSRECDVLEAQFREVREKSKSLQTQIEKRRNPEYLQGRMLAHGLGLVDISGTNIEIVDCKMPEDSVVARRPE